MLVIGGALLLAIAVLVVLATRGDAAPADGAVKLVPPDALVYAHLSTSEGRTQDARLLALAGRFSSVRELTWIANRGGAVPIWAM